MRINLQICLALQTTQLVPVSKTFILQSSLSFESSTPVFSIEQSLGHFAFIAAEDPTIEFRAFESGLPAPAT